LLFPVVLRFSKAVTATLTRLPINLRLKSNKTYSIEFKKEGYVTGSWYDLDQDHVNAILEKQQ
jgi:hypothetical protein